MAKTTAGILKISQEDIAQIAFPVPPPDEITECIRRFSEQAQSTNDTLAILEKTRTDRAALREAILKYAFEGRLVPQDPSDEPASIFLARLCAEAPAPRRARGRKTAS
jgi:type I restriction enzyme S subunit